MTKQQYIKEVCIGKSMEIVHFAIYLWHAECSLQTAKELATTLQTKIDSRKEQHNGKTA